MAVASNNLRQLQSPNRQGELSAKFVTDADG
jgi:hypothetical protein